MQGHAEAVYGVTFSPDDGAQVATASGDSTARIWDAASGSCTSTVAGHQGGLPGITFSPDRAQRATSSSDQSARISSL